MAAKHEGEAIPVTTARTRLFELVEALADGDLVLAEPFPQFVERLELTPSR